MICFATGGLVGVDPDLAGGGLESDGCGAGESTVPRDQLIASLGGGDDERDEDSVVTDAVDEPGEFRLRIAVEHDAERVRSDQCDRDRAGFGKDGRGHGCAAQPVQFVGEHPARLEASSDPMPCPSAMGAGGTIVNRPTLARSDESDWGRRADGIGQNV